ncbi:hypothetical protein [Amycolatopsis sp. H20-H5]|uniref:hypothetical protein n=1 Tax=Amycolatopsis sp. H20-H5 TaxID=3046309 RepID=UPI002DB889FE|nr:hypothetical protein [Amycolatopsis sp. H20-H5]MEC3977185.1 hypothetical protein [Amycolatopsis sp. H20-H5]
MNGGGLLLCAGLVLAPPLAWVVGIIVYNHHRCARNAAGRPRVADITARLAAETRAADQGGEPASEIGQDPSTLPAGWHWPTRDRDA